MEITLNKKVAKKVLETVDAGLTSGLGKAEPGKMCIEAAVNFALGLPHGDNPPCVGELVRSFKIALNDCKWPSDKARTAGMRKLAVAQLGSNEIDQQKFLELVGFKCMTRILPIILQNSIKEDEKNSLVAKIVPKLKAAIRELKAAKDFETAEALAKKARDIYWDNASAYACASASAYAYAYDEKNPTFNHKILKMTAQVGLEALVELKSPGVKWLSLCD